MNSPFYFSAMALSVVMSFLSIFSGANGLSIFAAMVLVSAYICVYSEAKRQHKRWSK